MYIGVGLVQLMTFRPGVTFMFTTVWQSADRQARTDQKQKNPRKTKYQDSKALLWLRQKQKTTCKTSLLALDIVAYKSCLALEHCRFPAPRTKFKLEENNYLSNSLQCSTHMLPALSPALFVCMWPIQFFMIKIFLSGKAFYKCQIVSSKQLCCFQIF